MKTEEKEANAKRFQVLQASTKLDGQLQTPQLALKKASPSGFHTQKQLILMEKYVFEDWNLHFDQIYIQDKPLSELLGKSSFDSQLECLAFIQKHLFGEVPASILKQKFSEILPELHSLGLMFAATSEIQKFHDTDSQKHKVLPIFVPSYHLSPTLKGFGVEEKLACHYFEDKEGKLIYIRQEGLTISHTSLFEVDTLKASAKTISTDISLPEESRIRNLELYRSILKFIPNKAAESAPQRLYRGIVDLITDKRFTAIQGHRAPVDFNGLIKEIESHISRHLTMRSDRKDRIHNLRTRQVKAELHQSISDVRSLVASHVSSIKEFETELTPMREQKQHSHSKAFDCYQSAIHTLSDKQEDLTALKVTLLAELDKDIQALQSQIEQIQGWPIKAVHQPNRAVLLELIQNHIKTLEDDRSVLAKETQSTLLSSIQDNAKGLFTVFVDAEQALDSQFKQTLYEHKQQLVEMKDKHKALNTRITALSEIYDVCCVKAKDHGTSTSNRMKIYLLRSAVNQLQQLKSEFQSQCTPEQYKILETSIKQIKDELSRILSMSSVGQFTQAAPHYFDLCSKQLAELGDIKGLFEAHKEINMEHKRSAEALDDKYARMVARFEEKISDLTEQGLSLSLARSSTDLMLRIEKDFDLLDEASLAHCKDKIQEKLNEYAHPGMFKPTYRNYRIEAEQLIGKVKLADSRDKIEALLEADLRQYNQGKGYKAVLMESRRVLAPEVTESIFDHKAA